MRVLLDTSVLVAAMIESHPAHKQAFPWLQHVIDGTNTGLVAAHSIVELYAILTTLPIQPRIPPSVAQRLIHENVINVCKVISLSDKDYASILEHLSESGIIGGVTYDALIMYSALKSDAERLVTLNDKDFRRIYPNHADKVTPP